MAGVVAFAYWRIARRHQHGRRFHGIRHRAADGGAAASVALGIRCRHAINEGLAAAESIYELLDEKPTMVDRRGRAGRSSSRPAPSTSRTSASPIHRGRHAGSQRLLAQSARRQDGGARRSLRRRQDHRHQPRGAAVRRGRRRRILIDGQDLRDVTLASLCATRSPSSARK